MHSRVIAVNTATFVGHKVKGFWGAVVATLGVILPSIIIISLIVSIIAEFAESEIVVHAFGGIRACVCALILSSIIKLGKKAIVDKLTLGVFCDSYASIAVYKHSRCAYNTCFRTYRLWAFIHESI